jgi:cardiolipin synthase
MVEGNAAWSLALIFLQMWDLGAKEMGDYGAFYPWRDAPSPVTSDG